MVADQRLSGLPRHHTSYVAGTTIDAIALVQRAINYAMKKVVKLWVLCFLTKLLNRVN